MTQAIFWIYSTISWIVFVIQKIELKSVTLRCETSMKTCYPGHTDWNTTVIIKDDTFNDGTCVFYKDAILRHERLQLE